MSILLFIPDTSVRGRETDTAQSMDNAWKYYNDYHAKFLFFFSVVFLLAWWMSGKSKYKVIDYSVLNSREIDNEIKKWLVCSENVKV